jgi:tRNA threonylcarbamoyladenosine biosynthesis protein TsaB
MAWSLGIPAIGISGLRALACNAAGFRGGIVPLFDARRGQVYSGLYRSGEDVLAEQEMPDRIILLRDWLPMIQEHVCEKPVLFLGDDVSIHRHSITEMLGEQALFAPLSLNVPRAAHIGFLSLSLLPKAGTAHQLMPEYLQVAEAEAKWLAANKQ